MVSLPAAVPVVEYRPSLPLLVTAVNPARTPRSRVKSSLTTTMRASISTWRTGMSSVATSERMLEMLSDVSWISSVLVRASIVTLPRPDSSDLPPRGSGASSRPAHGSARRYPRPWRSSPAGTRCAVAPGPGYPSATPARTSRVLASSSDGATMITLLSRRMPRPLSLQHHVQHLVPGHVLQAQREAAGDRIGYDDVLAAGVHDQLQQGAGLDVLEGQRHALAGVNRALRRPAHGPRAAAAAR